MVITDSMVLCAKIGPSILNADLSDLAGECTRLLDQVCVGYHYEYWVVITMSSSKIQKRTAGKEKERKGKREKRGRQGRRRRKKK